MVEGEFGRKWKPQETIRRKQKEEASMKDKLLPFGNCARGAHTQAVRGWCREQGLDMNDLCTNPHRPALHTRSVTLGNLLSFPKLQSPYL